MTDAKPMNAREIPERTDAPPHPYGWQDPNIPPTPGSGWGWHIATPRQQVELGRS